MKKSLLRPVLVTAMLATLLASPAAFAQLYKWVDANGKTHYSSSAAEAGVAPVKELKVDVPTTPAAGQREAAAEWQKKDAAFRERQARRNADDAQFRASGRTAAGPAWSGNPTTDSGRCALARDILNGSATLTNGQKTDSHGRELAERDVAKNCH